MSLLACWIWSGIGNSISDSLESALIHQGISNKCWCFVQAWKDWFDLDCPEEAVIPDGYNISLDTFHKLLLIRSWCPDRVLMMAKIYVAETLGRQVSHTMMSSYHLRLLHGSVSHWQIPQNSSSLLSDPLVSLAYTSLFYSFVISYHTQLSLCHFWSNNV